MTDTTAQDVPAVERTGDDVVVPCPASGAAAYLVDPDDGSATALGPVVAEPSWITGAAALPDGRVLITGGRAATSTAQGYRGPPLAAAETRDPVEGLRLVGPMADGRAGHTATALPDGRVLLVGGVERSPDRTDPEPVGAEIFDPAAAP